VCGLVNDAHDVQASWFNVDIYYTEDPSKVSSCQVSPSDNKYCCDAQEVEGVSWAIGKEINAEILSNGYSAGPVSLSITGEGFDIFPELNLEKIIQFHSPNSSLIFNANQVFVNISLAPGFDSLRYKLEWNNQSLEADVCSSCQHAEFYLENIEFGQYTLTLFASNGEIEVNETFTFTNSFRIDFARVIICDDCTDNFVPSNKFVTMRVIIDSPFNISGTLTDTFPNSWKFRDSDGFVQGYSETHDIISWDVQGSHIEKEYIIKSPKLTLTRDYIFQSSLEEHLGPQDTVTVFSFYKPFGLPTEKDDQTINQEDHSSYAEVTSDRPLVVYSTRAELLQYAIFPNKIKKKAFSYTQDKIEYFEDGSSIPFKINSNLKNKEIKEVLLRFKVAKPTIAPGKQESYLQILGETGDSWTDLLTTKFNEDKQFSYYESYSPKKGIFRIKSEFLDLKEVITNE